MHATSWVRMKILISNYIINCLGEVIEEAHKKTSCDVLFYNEDRGRADIRKAVIHLIQCKALEAPEWYVLIYTTLYIPRLKIIFERNATINIKPYELFDRVSKEFRSHFIRMDGFILLAGEFDPLLRRCMALLSVYFHYDAKFITEEGKEIVLEDDILKIKLVKDLTNVQKIIIFNSLKTVII